MKAGITAIAVLLLAATLLLPAYEAPPSVPKTKVFYLHTATQDLGAGAVPILNTTIGTPSQEGEDLWVAASHAVSWSLYPRLVGPVTLRGDVTLRFWMSQSNTSGPGTTDNTLTMTLVEIGPGGAPVGATIATGTVTEQVTTHYSEYFVTGNVAGTRTIPTGNSLQVTIDSASSNSVTKQLAWGSPRFRSRLELTLDNYLNIDAAFATDSGGMTPPYFDENQDIHIVATLNDPIGTYDVRWVNVTIVAPDGSVARDRVPMTLTLSGPATPLSTWEYVFSGASKPRGTYTATVEAVDNTGYYYRFPDRPGDLTFGGHLETVTFTFLIGQPVWVNVLVVDDANASLPGATVEFLDLGVLQATAQTGANGTANVTLPGTGAYTARVWWQGILVYDAPQSVAGNVSGATPLVFSVAVYRTTLEVVDVAFDGIAGAAVFVGHPNGTSTLVPYNTDSSGRVVIARTPGGRYELRVVWRGIEVFSGGIDVASSAVWRLDASVYYFSVQARDTRGLAVENVQALFTDPGRGLVVESIATGLDGDAVARLPAGTYDLDAFWSGRRVANLTGLVLATNRTEPIPLSVYYVTVRVVDSQDKTVLGAFVALESPGYTASGITDASGRVVDLRVPAGDFLLNVTWQGVVVHSATVTATPEGTINASVRIYYLTVRTEDASGNDLPEVFLSLSRGNEVVAAATTNAQGEAVFRLPFGDYGIDGRLVTTYGLSGVDQSEQTNKTLGTDDTATLRFAAFPIPIYTTILFWLVILALLLVLLILWLYLKQRKRQREAEREHGDDTAHKAPAGSVPAKGEETPVIESAPPAVEMTATPEVLPSSETSEGEPDPAGTPDTIEALAVEAETPGSPPTAESAPETPVSPELVPEPAVPAVPETAATLPASGTMAVLLSYKATSGTLCVECKGGIAEGEDVVQCSNCDATLDIVCGGEVSTCPRCGATFETV